MKLTGYSRCEFNIKDTQEHISGFNIYISQDIPENSGEGFSAERYFLSDSKIKNNNINIPELYNKNVKIFYNRYGKVDTIVED